MKSFKSMKDLPEKEVKKTVKKGGDLLLRTIKSKSHSKGVARNYDYITKNDSKYPMTVLMGVKNGKVGGSTITYAALASIQEYGAMERVPRKAEFKKVLINGKWRTMSIGNPFMRIPARPFVRPSIDENRDKINEILKDGLMVVINKQAKTNNLI